jgi:hypothetical protein
MRWWNASVVILYLENRFLDCLLVDDDKFYGRWIGPESPIEGHG